MKIQFVSDLHLEFPENRAYLAEHPLEVTGDILLVAGDTAYLDLPDSRIKVTGTFIRYGLSSCCPSKIRWVRGWLQSTIWTPSWFLITDCFSKGGD